MPSSTVWEGPHCSTTISLIMLKNVCEERCVGLHRLAQVFRSSSAVVQNSIAVSPLKGGRRGGRGDQVWPGSSLQLLNICGPLDTTSPACVGFVRCVRSTGWFEKSDSKPTVLT